MKIDQLQIPTAAVILIAGLLLYSCNKEGGDEPAPALPALSIADVSMPEGNQDGKLVFTVTLSKASGANVVVNYATLNGTAIAGQDYVAKTDGNLLFKPNETQKTIEIDLLADEVKENDNFFEVLLLNPVNATLEKPRAKGTILNDDQDNALVIPTTGYTSPLTYPGRNLVWADEFSGTALNTSDWTFEIGTGQSGWGNNELQYYRAENTTLVNGNLVIEARQEGFGSAAYTSSRLITRGKKEFKFGRIDIRAALPKGQGLWPALWMLGSNFQQIGWPACGEIDIMELVGHVPNRVHGTVHFGPSVNQRQERSASRALSGNATFSDEFHVFSLEWEQDRIRWFLDGEQFHEITPADMGGAAYPFNQPFFFIFNVAVGGNWPGSPDNTTMFPQRMIVDYVRVFQ